MHIGIYCTTHRPIPPKDYGGVQIVNWVTAEALVKSGHKVTVFGNSESKTSGNLIAMPSGSGDAHEEKLAIQFKKQIYECDILIDTSTFSFPGRLYKDIPYIIRTGGDCNRRYCQFWDRNIVFPSQDQYNHHNKNNCACFKRRIAKAKESGIFLTPPILRKPVCYWIYSQYTYDFDKFCSCDEYSDKYYIYMGSIEPIKGVHLAVEFALKTRIHFVIAGSIKDKQYWKSKVEPYLCKKINYLGEIPTTGARKWGILGSAKALVYPTNCHDADPNVPKETLFVKTPVIGLANGALPEIVTDGKTGVLCNSVQEMVDRHKELDDIDTDLCRKEVLEKFSVETYRDNLVSILEDIIGGKSWH